MGKRGLSPFPLRPSHAVSDPRPLRTAGLGARALEALLEVKSRTKEQGQVARSPLLDRWIAAAAEAGRDFADTLSSDKSPLEELDVLFHRLVMRGI